MNDGGIITTYPIYTALTAGVIVFIQMGLMFLTIRSRYELKQGLGDGGHADLLARIRSHGNLTENAPIILIVMAFLEMSGLNPVFIAIYGILFIIARLLHPIGLFKTSGTSLPRLLGVFLTTFVGLTGASVLIYSSIARLIS